MAQRKNSNNLKLFNRDAFPLFTFLISFIFCLTIMGLDYRHHFSKKMKTKLSVIQIPINSLINFPVNLFHDTKKYFTSQTLLKEKIKNLEKANYSLSIQTQENELIKSENKLLRNKLKIHKNFNIEGINAEIILPSIRGGYKVITINKGIKHNINEGAPVINAKGLVGQIINTFKTYSEIKPITSSSFAVPAILNKGIENFILYGNGNGELEIPLFPASSLIKINDIFVTSGIDDLYPKGIKIGKVIRVEPTKSPKFNNILIRPFSQPTSFTQITVLKEKKR